ncbi:MAG: PepSY-like domain-containing protein [Rikenellaceae bacterium]
MKRSILTIALAVFTLAAVAQPGGGPSPKPSQHQSHSNPDTKKITSEIQRMYRGASIKEIEKERTGYEVEIIHEKRSKEVKFNNSINWVSTTYDIRSSELPPKIQDAIKRSKYGVMRIDDVDVIETPKRNYYEIEFDKLLGGEAKARIDFNGKFL